MTGNISRCVPWFGVAGDVDALSTGDGQTTGAGGVAGEAFPRAFFTEVLF